MDDRSELHWRYLKDNLDHSRHHETIRASSANLILFLAGAGFTVVGYDKCISYSDYPVLAFIVILSVFGALFAAKQTERAAFHYERSRTLRKAIDDGPHAPSLEKLKDAADAVHEAKYPWLFARELRSFWFLLYFLIAGLAAVLMGLAVPPASCPT